MARSLGLEVAPRVDRTGDLSAEVDFDAYRSADIEALMEAWVPVTVAATA